jgi:uncharacterized protein (DUF1778 family)
MTYINKADAKTTSILIKLSASELELLRWAAGRTAQPGTATFIRDAALDEARSLQADDVVKVNDKKKIKKNIDKRSLIS